MSPGLMPLRRRSTCRATWRNASRMFGPYDSRPPASTFSRRWNTVGSRACCASAAIALLEHGRVGQHHHALNAALAQVHEGGFELDGHAGIEDLRFEPKRARRIQELTKLDCDAGAVWIAHRPDAARGGDDLPRYAHHQPAP